MWVIDGFDYEPSTGWRRARLDPVPDAVTDVDTWPLGYWVAGHRGQRPLVYDFDKGGGELLDLPDVRLDADDPTVLVHDMASSVPFVGVQAERGPSVWYCVDGDWRELRLPDGELREIQATEHWLYVQLGDEIWYAELPADARASDLASSPGGLPSRVLRPGRSRPRSAPSTGRCGWSPTSTTAPSPRSARSTTSSAGHRRRGARPHELVGVALHDEAAPPHRARHERRRARRQPAGAGARSCTTSTPTRRCRSPTTRSTPRCAACRSTTSCVRSRCSPTSPGSCGPGGPFVCTFSNRCFPTKAIRGWLYASDAEHGEIVAEYFRRVRRVRRAGDRAPHARPGHFGDPLWAVWATVVRLADA